MLKLSFLKSLVRLSILIKIISPYIVIINFELSNRSSINKKDFIYLIKKYDFLLLNYFRGLKQKFTINILIIL